MSVRALNWGFEHLHNPHLPDGEARLLLALCDMADDQGRMRPMTLKQLSVAIGRGVSTVQRRLDALAAPVTDSVSGEILLGPLVSKVRQRHQTGADAGFELRLLLPTKLTPVPGAKAVTKPRMPRGGVVKSDQGEVFTFDQGGVVRIEQPPLVKSEQGGVVKSEQGGWSDLTRGVVKNEHPPYKDSRNTTEVESYESQHQSRAEQRATQADANARIESPAEGEDLTPRPEDLNLIRQWETRLLAVAGPGLADPAKEHRLLLTTGVFCSWAKAGVDLELDAVPTIAAKTRLARKEPAYTWSVFTKDVLKSVALRTQVLTVPTIEASDVERIDPAQGPRRMGAGANTLRGADDVGGMPAAALRARTRRARDADVGAGEPPTGIEVSSDLFLDPPRQGRHRAG